MTLIGSIEQSPGTGAIIRSANAALWDEQLSPPLVSDVQATLELIIARRVIESGVAELAVKNVTKKDIQQIGKLIQEMAKALKEERTKDYSKLDMEFHRQIASSSHNRYMIHMFVTIRNLMEQFIRETFIVIPGLLKRSLKFHNRVYEDQRKGSAKDCLQYGRTYPRY